MWHEPRAQSGARIKPGHSTGHCRPEPTGDASLQAPQPSHLPAATHTPASVPERWRPLVVKKEMRFVLRTSSFLQGEKRPSLRKAWQRHFYSGCDYTMAHRKKGENTPSRVLGPLWPTCKRGQPLSVNCTSCAHKSFGKKQKQAEKVT